jgi:hypothetical protein
LFYRNAQAFGGGEKKPAEAKASLPAGKMVIMNLRWKSLLDLQGINFWLVASGIILNGIWTYITVFLALRALANDPATTSNVQVGLLFSLFVGNFLVGFIIGKLSHDVRGPTYGIVCSVGSVGLVLYALLPAGLVGLLAAVVALAGGFNGGIMSLPRPPAR